MGNELLKMGKGNKKKQKKRPLTIRQRKARKLILKGLPARVALRQAGYSPKNADKNSAEVLEKLGIQELMEKQGLTDELTINTIKDAHTANKTISAVVTGKEAKDAGGLTTDFVDVPDWSNRLKASELSMKLKGRLREKADVEITGDIKISWAS